MDLRLRQSIVQQIIVQTYYLLLRDDGDPDLVDHVCPAGLQKDRCIHHTDLFTCREQRITWTLGKCQARAQFLYYLCQVSKNSTLA